VERKKRSSLACLFPPPTTIKQTYTKRQYKVAGGTASGKTTVCERIMRRLNDKSIVLLSQDSFYRPLSAEQAAAARRNAFNFDHPDAFDTALLVACLRSLSEGRAFDCPVYDFAAHARARETRRIEPVDVVVLEGILVLAVPAVRDACSLRVYVDTDDDVRLARRIQVSGSCFCGLLFYFFFSLGRRFKCETDRRRLKNQQNTHTHKLSRDHSQHKTTQNNTTQHNTTQHNTTQHKTQHNTTQHNTARRGGPRARRRGRDRAVPALRQAVL